MLLYENGEAASGSAVSQEDYETTTVRQETYKEEYYDTADLDYTDTETIYIDDEDAVLDSIKVKKDQKVNKGDVLAVYHVETSKTKLQKEKILVQQARANYESGLRMRCRRQKKNWRRLKMRQKRRSNSWRSRSRRKNLPITKRARKKLSIRRRVTHS